MSQSVVDALEEQTVVASLQAGPKGTVCLTYEYPHLDLAKSFLAGFTLPAQRLQAYVCPPVIELDRANCCSSRSRNKSSPKLGLAWCSRYRACCGIQVLAAMPNHAVNTDAPPAALRAWRGSPVNFIVRRQNKRVPHATKGRACLGHSSLQRH